MTKVKTLDFAALVPERHKFRDQDGKEYEFLNPEGLDAAEYARLNKLRKRIDNFINAEDDNEEAGSQFDQDVSDILRIILPGLPKERLDALKLGQKSTMLEFWFNATSGEESGPETEGEAVAN